MAKGRRGRNLSASDLLMGRIDPPDKRTVEHLRLTPFGSGMKVERSPELLDYLRKISARRTELDKVPVAPKIDRDRAHESRLDIEGEITFKRGDEKESDLDR
jgi:hypothetical protein